MATRRKKPARKAAKKRPPARSAAKRTVDRRKKDHPATLRLREVTPGFTVNDLDRSVRFYRDILGFHVQEEWKHEGKVIGVELRAGAIKLYLGQDDFAKGRDRVKGIGFRMYCDSGDDVDAIATRIRRNGGVLDHDPVTQSWGTRDFGITDPDGFKITIANER